MQGYFDSSTQQEAVNDKNLEDFFSASSADLIASLDDYDNDVIGWINDLLDTPAAQKQINGEGATQLRAEIAPLELSELDKRVNFLTTRLEIASQDTSSQIEQTLDDISRTVPRLTYDLQFMRESALTLQLALQAVEQKGDIATSTTPGTHSPSSLMNDEITTAAALSRLHFLSVVKSRMEASRVVLREAENWSTLEPEVTSLLAAQSYEKAAERLAEASKSMSVFQNTPEFDMRRALMTSLQNQLEAALSAALVAAVNARDVATCRSFYAIFGNIQREAEFQNYYFGARRAALVPVWQAARLSDCEDEGRDEESAAAPIRLAEFLSRFFPEFLALIEEERTFAMAIFPNPQYTLSAFIQATLDAFSPSFAQRLSGMTEHYGSAALPELISAFRVTEEFAVSVEKILEKAAYSSLLSASSPNDEGSSRVGANKSHSRRLSKRMSISRRIGPNRSMSISGPSSVHGGGSAWEQVLFEPFIDFQAEYSALERKYLDESLQAAIKTTGLAGDRDTSDGVRLLRERSVTVFTLAEDSLSRCMSFTHGYGAVGLIQAVNHVFATFLRDSRDTLLSSGGAGTTLAASNRDDEEELGSELDYTAEDWTSFQLALHLLEACRVVHERLGRFEGKVRASLIQVASAFRLARADPAGHYIPGTTRGEALLLAQSPLNSAELHSLLDSLEATPVRSTPTGMISPSPNTPRTGPSFLIDGARTSLSTFTRECQLYLQTTILSPLRQHLSTYPTLPVWSTPSADQQRKRGGAFDLQMPTFSLSPSHTIQRVAEGLLNLPRLFEVYADDDALAFSLETLPFVDADSLRASLEPSASTPGEGDSVPRKLSISRSPQPASSPSSSPLPLASALTPEMVSTTWLSSLALSLLSHFTTATLPSIRALSASGAAQLASDLGYLANIVRALNVEWDNLDRWRELAEMSDDEGRRKMDEMGEEERDGEDGQDRTEVLSAVARMRGWGRV
ncbi:hypothetical protein BOTBODRAFT_186473 [Botryobasidium botryosum FD-172 SS1]|uniref:Conserved oligomeric Golgi complex subunit 7 n=1 Tax=Botryobasidium botryosum (strain FD-172 SS1) TaxID=930990 RepID=A0A067MMW5_BOTB1|nr:hypothetical protein BOTBODRAFT_186473 [Botryobasidium botryosum FD-172 SS1]